MVLPTEKFNAFPEHYRILETAVQLLAADPRVLGIYLTGSFANGQPDQYSDLDINVLVSAVHRDAVVRDHHELRRQVEKIVTWFPALHLDNVNQIVVLYACVYPLHVDYLYGALEELEPQPQARDSIVLLDKTGALEEWKRASADARGGVRPTAEDLQYLEDPFWAWCIYTHGKIRRGELWEVRDALEYLRSHVLLRLAYYALGLVNEGNRRLEQKFPRWVIAQLEQTLPEAHTQPAYDRSLTHTIDAYIDLFGRAESANRVESVTHVDRAYFVNAIQTFNPTKEYINTHDHTRCPT